MRGCLRFLMSYESMERQEELDDDTNGKIAAGIFRGEGTIFCFLHNYGAGRHRPTIRAAVSMCDRDSVEIVAREWDVNVLRDYGSCPMAIHRWRALIEENQKVREVMLRWIALGWLRGEKADQYFDAIARYRRAKELLPFT